MISEALRLSSQLRVPVFKREDAIRTRITQLEEAMLVNAFHAGNLAEERLEAMEKLRPLDDEWDTMVGWESVRSSGRKTEAGVDEAKAKLNPDLARQRRDLNWTIARLTEEIDRLERDATKCSRAYTMIAGPG